MAYVYSTPVDALIDQAVSSTPYGKDDDIVIHDTDVVIVGSGYGASVAAMKIAGLVDAQNDRIGVTVLERGLEYAVGEFPNTAGELPGFIRFQRPSDARPSGNPDALFDLRLGYDTDVLVGSGLGGGSLINANVAARPAPEQLDNRWPDMYRYGALDPAFDEIERLLGVNTDTAGLRKYDAFETLGDSLGEQTHHAPIAVMQTSPTQAGDGRPSAGVGISQSPCTNCGNCVTGCNVGAKNTLMMNLIPLAAERGAEFFTGANVLTVAPAPVSAGRRWRLRLQRTQAIGTPLEDEHFFVDADYVILAAGALGSTEILQRSAAVGGLPVSDRLGRGFSTNGDGIGFSFGQNQAVHALGTPQIHSTNGPGPTITGIIRSTREHDGRWHRYTLEDGAIPASLVKLFGEITTTSAALGRIGDYRMPAWFAQAAHDHDPLAYNAPLLEHNQMLLMMSDDGARRRLSLSPPPDGVADSDFQSLMQRHAVVGALDAGDKAMADAGLLALDRALMEQSFGDGLAGGQYLTNPLWRLLPEAAASVLSGTLPGGRSLSVHPLGGCRMGASAGTGVVDAQCQVFDGSGGVHQGLYVMDGSVLPAPLATNPFLTIAGVAWLASDALVTGPLAADGWSASASPWTVATPPGLFRRHDGDPPTPSARLILREQMLGHLSTDDAGIRNQVAQLIGDRVFGRDGVILRFELQPMNVHDDFAALPNARVEVPGQARLYVNPVDAAQLDHSQQYGAPAELEHKKPIASGPAQVSLLELDAPGDKLFKRRTRAIRAYLKRRSGGVGNLGWNPLEWLSKALGFWRVAGMHANYRQFRYRVTLTTDNGTTIAFTARKRLRWQNDHARLWDSLLELPVERLRITAPDAYSVDVEARFQVDAAYMLDQGLIQAAPDATNMIETITSTLSFLAWFVRCILQTSFWEFGSPGYDKPDPVIDLTTPDPLQPANRPPVVAVRVPLPVQDDHLGTLNLELVRYPQPAAGAEPVLLIHGLAQGSGIFNTRHLPDNMATHFWEKGYDVWLLDHRLSNRVDVPHEMFAIDAVGRDVESAVRNVFGATGKPVKVFAHCVGAIGTQMALLGGLLRTQQGDDMVESVCFNAIHPWIVPSASNLVRLKLGSFARTWISDDLLDPIVRQADGNDAVRSVLDRLAFSLSRIAEDTDRGNEDHGKEGEGRNGICDRMTFFYGRMWRHENLSQALHDHWHELVGRAPAEVFQQLYFLLERERILDDHAENTYLRHQNLINHWSNIPTFFVHGNWSDVFNPQSATRSAVRMERIFRSHENANGVILAPVRLRRYPEMGHMDPILGKDAYQTVYEDIFTFFESARQWRATQAPMPHFDPIDTDHDPYFEPRWRPETGEVLRGAWIQDQRVITRYWLERYRYNTTDVIGAWSLVLPTGQPLPNQPFRLPDSPEQFLWFDSESIPKYYQAQQSVLAPTNPTQTESALAIAPLDLSLTEIQRTLLGQVQLFMLGALTAFSFPQPVVTDAQPSWYQRLVRRMRNEAGAHDTFNFLLGSCRYPGTPVERDNADQVFGAMRDGLQDIDLLFFVGDQIYADAYANIFAGEGWRETYYRSYITAFNSHNLAELLKAVPVHFAMDDHEIVDNYSGHNGTNVVSAPRTGSITYASINPDQARFAVGAARAYMSSGREVRPVPEPSYPPPPPPPNPHTMWYALDHVHETNFPCFVLDTRSERELRAAYRHQTGQYPSMMHRTQPPHGAQLEALRNWLSRAQNDQPDRPKFVFAGQIIAPVTNRLIQHPSLFRREDGFFGYPDTLRALGRYIADNQIRNVVFVGGDLHFSCAAQIELYASNQGAITVWQVVASGLYAPLDFANGNPSEYTWLRDSPDWRTPTLRHAAGDLTIRYRAEWLARAPAHFVRVSVGTSATGPGWELGLRAYDCCGNVIPPPAFDLAADDLRVRFLLSNE